MTRTMLFGLLAAAGLLSTPAVAQNQNQNRSQTSTNPGPEISLYNQGASVVTETRTQTLESGAQFVTWPDVAEQIAPETLMLRGEGVTLVGSRYLRDTLNGRALLERRVGQRVTLLREDGQGGDIVREGRLVSAGGTPIVKVDERIEILDSRSPWRIALGELPEQLPASAQLRLHLNAEQAGEIPLRLTYQVGGLAWRGEYVGRYDDEAHRLSLNAQAVLRNNSGGDFTGAGVTLVAGNIQRTGNGSRRPMMMRAAADSAGYESAPEAEKAFEYYRYDLPGRVDLLNSETRAVSLFHAQSLDVEREYRLESGWRSNNGDTPSAHPEIRVRFSNTLGRPLPAGAVRVYDDADTPLLLGEDRIRHTPEDAPVSLTLGRAFDIRATRRVTDSRRDGQTRESERRIVVSNGKSESVKVKVVERLPGDWKVTSQSLPHNKVDANRVAWTVGVPAGGKAVLNYRVRYH